MIALALILGIFGVVILNAIFRAWVLTFFWAWFIVPLGAPNIGLGMAFGLALTANLLTYHYRYEEEPRDAEEAMSRLGKTLLMGALLPLLALGIGAVAHAVIS